MALNKRGLMIVSSLAAIPLTIVLIAAASDRARRHKLLQSRGFSRQTKSKTSVSTTIPTHSQQQKEKSKAQPQSPWQDSDTRAATITSTTATISTSTTVADKDVITAPKIVSSAMVTSSTSDSAVVVPSSPSASSSQTQKEEEISVSEDARKAGESLKELIVTAIKEAKDSAKGTGKRLKEQTINIATTADSKDIHSLGDTINFSVGLFEETMTEIRKERYNEQIKLLDSYKDLLHSHIKVIDARRRMASKLKPGA